MKSRYLSVFCLVVALITTLSNVCAQPVRLKFLKLSIDEGLSSSIVSSILQDHQGFIWIGTVDGLNRYDGFKFVEYKNYPEDSSSLSNNVILTMYEDHQNNILLGTENGLVLYNSKEESFLNYAYDKSSPLRGLACSIKKITEDSVGNLWLASSVGLIYFDRKKNSIVTYTHESGNPNSLSNDNVESVLIDKSGRLWVTTRKGLNLFKPATETFFNHFGDGDPGDKVSNIVFIDMVEDRDGNIWFGSNNGLFCMERNTPSKSTNLIHYQYDSGNKSSLSINQITSLFVDDSGNLWIGTENGGLNLFDKQNKNFWHYRIDDYDPQSLNNESIESIYQDNVGNLWIGTYTGGLNIAMKNSNAINKYQNLPGAPLSLSHNTVTSFFEDRQNQIWLGTDGGGLNLFNVATNRFRRYTKENSLLNSNSILAINEDSQNIIWLGTWAGGLVKFDSKTGSLKSFNSTNSNIQDDNIFAIEQGFDNDLWLGSFEHGLIHYQIKENKFTDYTLTNSGIANEMIIKIVKFSHGRLLLGTPKNLQIYSPRENQFITYSHNPENKNSLSDPRVTDILAESDSSVWIGTPNGLNHFNPLTGYFKSYYEKDGLPGNFIKALVLDNSGNLWITTSNGICRFDYRNNIYKNFTKADGLQSNEFSERSVLKTTDGALYMGGTKGFNVIYPEKIIENKTIPAVLITDFKLFDKSVKPGIGDSPLNQSITKTKSITLTHAQSVLTFTFAVMDFSAPEKNQFAYMLENFDRDWIYPGNKGEATYTNLNPGHYILHVKGSNNDGLWNQTGTSLKITILPPWYGTIWFRIIAFVGIFLLISLIFVLRLSNLKRHKLKLEETVAIKTLELKELNSSKDKFFSIIAHDLKHPFNTIIGFSGLLKDQADARDPEKIQEIATIINNSAVQTFRLLENLLDWANAQRKKITFIPVQINLYKLMEEEFPTLNNFAVAKEIELRNRIPDNIILYADRNMIRTIIRNLISNAIKFTNRNGIVEISALGNNNSVEISISDTGVGMSEEVIAKLFRIDGDVSTQGTENEKGTGLGLFLCKEFVDQHSGKIFVKSNPGIGSEFKIVLPVGKKSLQSQQIALK